MKNHSQPVLVLNAGSSSLKFSLFRPNGGERPQLSLNGNLQELYSESRFKVSDANGVVVDEKRWTSGDWIGHEGAMTFLFEWLRSRGYVELLAAVGHRVVHGGGHFYAPVLVDAAVIARLEQTVPLAPLHQPHAIQPMKYIAERLPNLPQVACFDTAFHATQSPVASAFALPEEITRLGVRRYGFHGLSYEHIASVLGEYDPRAAEGRTIALHLGNGSSMCAMRGAKCVTTTMGFTPVDGLPMGTRCGSLDPGVILFLMDNLNMDARSLERLLYYESGLLGVSGISSDMRTLEASAEPRARWAVDLFIYHIGRQIGSLAAALGGLDAIVFTAGIGENDAALRRRVCDDAAWLGVEFDETSNAKGGPRITTPMSAVSAWIIPTDEEVVIARHTLACVS